MEPDPDLLTVVTPTIFGREEKLVKCMASVAEAGILTHVVVGDVDHEGPAVARNRGVEEVVTPWVLFLDDDDWLHENYLEVMGPELTDDRDVVYSWCETINVNQDLCHGLDLEGLRRANFIPVTACVRTDLFRSVGGFPTDVAYEDWGLWLRILDAGGTFHLVKEKLWTYCRGDDSRSWSNQDMIARGKVRPV